MYWVLFRVGVLTTAIVAGGTALAAANATNAPIHTPAAAQVGDEDICLYLGGVWHCFEDLESDQSSSESNSSNS